MTCFNWLSIEKSRESETKDFATYICGRFYGKVDEVNNNIEDAQTRKWLLEIIVFIIKTLSYRRDRA